MENMIKELTWSEVREDVLNLNPKLCEIIDALNPSKEHTFFKARYSFGDEIIKKGVLHIPHNEKLVPLHSQEIDSKTQEKLGYNDGSNPVSIILKNTTEIFTLIGEHTVPLYYGLIPAGKLFSTSYILGNNSAQFHPAFLWNMTAGARSMFMLPRISDYIGHSKIMRELKTDQASPKYLLDHWHLFKEIVRKSQPTPAWQTEILFFSRKWFENLDDTAWRDFRLYMFQKFWDSSGYWRNQYVWNLVFCVVQQNKNLKPNPYLADTVKHILAMSVGAAPGFAPAVDNTAGPCKLLEQIYTDIYQIKDYQPIIMHPHIFSNQENRPVYYSLEYPCTMEFSPKSKRTSNKITNLIEIAYIINKYFSEIKSGDLNIQGTPFYDLADAMKFEYFHSNIAEYDEIEESSIIPKGDKFMQPLTKKAKNLQFPNNSPFARGCIRVMDNSKKE